MNDNFTEEDLVELERSINSIIAICHKMNAHWWVDPINGEDLRNERFIVPTKMALMHSEISEALEGHRKDKMDDHLPHLTAVETEMADLFIRAGDLAGAMNWNVGRAAREKQAYNMIRPDHKAANRVKKGGKKY
jgi:hypothetical protein